MGEDCGALRMHPVVAVGVIEMPVGVYEVFDRVRTYFARASVIFGSGRRVTGIDDHFTVRPCQDGDVSARTDECADISAQWLDSYVGCLQHVYAR